MNKDRKRKLDARIRRQEALAIVGTESKEPEPKIVEEKIMVKKNSGVAKKSAKPVSRTVAVISKETAKQTGTSSKRKSTGKGRNK